MILSLTHLQSNPISDNTLIIGLLPDTLTLAYLTPNGKMNMIPSPTLTLLGTPTPSLTSLRMKYYQLLTNFLTTKHAAPLALAMRCLNMQVHTSSLPSPPSLTAVSSLKPYPNNGKKAVSFLSPKNLFLMATFLILDQLV
jgi:hypothetical protein